MKIYSTVSFPLIKGLQMDNMLEFFIFNSGKSVIVAGYDVITPFLMILHNQSIIIFKNSVVKKMRKNFLNAMQELSPENSVPLPRNKKNEMISLSCDVNDHSYSNSKSI